MERRIIESATPLEKRIGFSRAVRIGNAIAVSGTAPIGPDGATIGGNDVYEQTLACLRIGIAAIEELGGSAGDVLRTRIMLVDISHWERAASAHGEIFADVRPACTFVEVKGFIRPEWLVETEVDAVVRG